MIHTLGRVLVREGKTVGLFIPMSSNDKVSLGPGLYEVREIMGSLNLIRIGEPAMENVKLQAKRVDHLVQDPYATMTADEIRECCEPPEVS